VFRWQAGDEKCYRQLITTN